METMETASPFTKPAALKLSENGVSFVIDDPFDDHPSIAIVQRDGPVTMWRLEVNRLDSRHFTDSIIAVTSFGRLSTMLRRHFGAAAMLTHHHAMFEALTVYDFAGCLA